MSLEILVEWRHLFRRGVPISTAIESKLEAMAERVPVGLIIIIKLMYLGNGSQYWQMRIYILCRLPPTNVYCLANSMVDKFSSGWSATNDIESEEFQDLFHLVSSNNYKEKDFCLFLCYLHLYCNLKLS